MVPAATLKAFLPLGSFDGDERDYWQRYAAGATAPPPRSLLLDRERGLKAATATLVAEREHAEVIERRGATFVCPHRTRLRLLASLLAFRRSIPAEVVGAFMPPDEIERAAGEIEAIRAAHPRWRSHILESAWEVPLHWFVAFDDAERQLTREADGSLGLRYETSIRAARERCGRAVRIVRATVPNPAVVGPVAGLARWLEDFAGAGLLVLDYGGVARLLGPAGLRRDRTCREIWAAVRALAEGDPDRAAAHYLAAAERWAALRGRESWN